MRRWVTLAWASALMFLVLLSFIWSSLAHRAHLQTESMLDYAMLDLDSTLNGSIDTMLMHSAVSIAEEVGAPEAIPTSKMAGMAARRGLDEINVIAGDGTIIASTDGRLVGATIADNPNSAEFLTLTNGVTHALAQRFRQGAHNPDARRKYVGAALPGAGWLVQVGIDESHVVAMFPAIMGFIFDEWLLGRTGFFLCADMSDGHLISNPARHRDEARFLAETGYNPDARGVREDAKTSFRQRLFGELCDCRAVVFCGHRIIAALPPAEYYSVCTFYGAVMAIVIAAVLITLVLLVRRIDISSERLQAFYKAEDKRRAREMEVAKTVQTSALPGPLPESSCFRLAASMQAARDVGGDFYDYFALDHTHIAFLVADVSGKGITAALYMMTTKTLIKDTLAVVRDPAAALTTVNGELCRNNSANMFLTAWVGVLDLETGVVSYASAGHNPPAIMRVADGVSLVTGKSGPVLAFLDGVEYKPLSLKLNPGDSLFLYTDGVTEALDARDELFGERRLLDALGAARGAEPTSVCNIVRAVVTAFAEGVPQADDITVLSIKYLAPPRSFSRSFPPTMEGVAGASDFLDEVPDVPPAKRATLHVILDEICSNIVRHSGASGFYVDVEIASDPPRAKLVFIDDGTPYDPLAHTDPDTTLPAEDRPIGGLGIMMVKRMASSVSYRRAHNRNFLIVWLALDNPAASPAPPPAPAIEI